MTHTQRESIETALMILQGLGHKKMCNNEKLTDEQLAVFILIDAEKLNELFWNLVEENEKLKAKASFFDNY